MWGKPTNPPTHIVGWGGFGVGWQKFSVFYTLLLNMFRLGLTVRVTSVTLDVGEGRKRRGEKERERE